MNKENEVEVEREAFIQAVERMVLQYQCIDFHQWHYWYKKLEELEEESEKVTGIPELSRLDKWQASNLIDSLSAMEGIQEVYG